MRSAQKQLAHIDRIEQNYIIDAVRGLANDPRSVGCKKLSGRDAWRIRVESYRVFEQQGITTLARLRKELKNTIRLEELARTIVIDTQYLMLLRREIEGSLFVQSVSALCLRVSITP